MKTLIALFLMGLSAQAAGPKPVKVALKDATGTIKGTLTLSEADHGVQITGDLKGLPPGAHGFHFHETGMCTAPDFKSAGGHFNPDGKEHGDLSAKPSHNGDMANVDVGADGNVHVDLLNSKVTLKPGQKNSLLKAGGTALVVHAKADDYKTQPTGDAGDRLLCGEIQSPEKK